jgi:hypothetical protein
VVETDEHFISSSPYSRRGAVGVGVRRHKDLPYAIFTWIFQAWRDVKYGPKRTVPSIALQRILL